MLGLLANAMACAYHQRCSQRIKKGKKMRGRDTRIVYTHPRGQPPSTTSAHILSRFDPLFLRLATTTRTATSPFNCQLSIEVGATRYHLTGPRKSSFKTEPGHKSYKKRKNPSSHLLLVFLQQIYFRPPPLRRLVERSASIGARPMVYTKGD